MPQINTFSRLAAALAIGLMIGMERGWQFRDGVGDGQAAGLRTFGLTGLLGGICGVLIPTLGPQIVGFVFVAYSLTFAALTWVEAKFAGGVSGTTTLVAAMLTFLLGTLAVVGEIRTAIAAAASMTVLLALRTQLHRWIARVTWEEIRAGLILMVMSFLLLPVLPDHPIDPWNAVNLHQVWLLAIMMALISFMGYIAVRIFGDQLGIIVTAAAGGLASSTATTLTLARLARNQPEAVNLLSGGIMISGAVMAIRVGVIASLLNPALLPILAPPLAAACLTMAAISALLVFVVGGKAASQAGPRLEIRNPLEVATSLKLALFIVVVLLASELVQRVWGSDWVLAVAAVSGVADLDAITLSMARLTTGFVLASEAILLAAAVNTVAKATMAGWLGGKAVGLRIWAASALAIAVAAAVFFWVS